MFQFFKITKAVWILNVVLLVLSFSVSSARAWEVFYMSEGVIPSDMISGQKLLEPDPNAREDDKMYVWNFQSLTVQMTVDWQYDTDDVMPVYDMATYQIQGESAINLINPRESKSQNGSVTITIPPYKSLSITLNSDGADGGAKLGLTVHSVKFPPTLVIQTANAVLNTGVPADFQPVSLASSDDITSPTTSFSISPTLPTGLTMNSDGVITGTPTVVQSATNYTVTATRGEAASTKDITLEIVSSVLAKLDVPSVSVRMGGPMTAVTPVIGSSGTQSLTYSVLPELPSGLSISSTTGIITGTPAAVTASASYTITITDGVTSASKAFALVVLPSADAPLATPETVTWQAGVASEVFFGLKVGAVNSGSEHPYISLKPLGGGAELSGTTGYPSKFDLTDHDDGFTLKWANPVVGSYSGKVYFLEEISNSSRIISFTLNVTGDKFDQTISFTSTAPSAVAGGATYTPVATATSALTVAFSIDSSSTDNCQISAGVVSFLDAGLCVINADQAGDSTHNGAPQVQQVVEVAAGEIGTTAQTVTFTTAAPTPTLGGLDYTPTVTASSSLSVQLYGDQESKLVCWPVGNKVVFLTAGSCTVRAEQVGNFQYARAETSQTFTVAEAVTLLQTVRNQALSSGSLITPFTPVTGANGVGALTYAISPTLSDGLSFSTTTGEITGTPTAPVAETTYTVTVTDTNASSGSKTFTLTITDGPAATLAVASKGLTINTAASFTPVTGSGGTGTLSYTVAPALPAPLSMSSATGLITGTPSATSAAANYTVTVTDQNSRTDTAIFALTVNGSVVATQAIAAPHVTQGFAATAFAPVTGAGGTAALSYSVAPDLPAGLSMASATGQISGTATSASSATTYTVTVTDANSATDTATFSLTVDGAVSATQAVATKALTKDAQITAFTPVTGAVGRAPLAYSVSPDLPTGLAMASGTGAITGTPTVTSSATTYTVTVTDANSATASATFSLTINDAVVATQAVSTKTLSANVAATAFTPVTGTGGTGTLAYSVSPALPAGLDIDEDTGEISGTATAGSSAATYTVTVTDDVLATDTETFTLSIDGPVAATTAIATTQLPVHTEVTAFTPVTGSGGTGALSYTVLPNLPAGLSMASQTGAITGTPTTPTAAATYTVTVTDANNTTDTADFSLSVNTIANSITLVASNTAPQPGETITLTATVSPSQATGSVTFKDGGNALGAPVTLVSGVATYTTADLGIGNHTLTAEYGGSATYDGSTSSGVAVSLLSPSSEFDQNSAAIKNAIQGLGLSTLGSQAQNSMGALQSAVGRMSSNSNAGSNIGVSSMSAPVAFHGELTASDGNLHADTNFFGQNIVDGGAKRRLVFGTLVISKTDGGTTSAILNSRMAWEWSSSEDTMLGYWLGLDATRSKISSTFSGHQTSLGVSAGVYAVERLADGIFLSGFASMGQDKRFLQIGNTVLDLTSDFISQSRMIGTALTASIKHGRIELRPEFSLTYGQMDIGMVDFVGTAYGQTDDTLSTDMGNVSVANVRFSPEVIFTGPDQTSQLTLSPHLDCQQVNASATTNDCGGGASVAFEHTSPDGLTSYFARIRSEAISGVAQTSVEVNLRQQF